MLIGTQAFCGCTPSSRRSQKSSGQAGKAISKPTCVTVTSWMKSLSGPLHLRGVYGKKWISLFWLKAGSKIRAMIASGDALRVALYKEYNNSG